MIAIVDCNSFYCSCEKLFRPELTHQPVVVLSNNDGCIISRTDEAKKLGISMAGAYFESKEVIEKNKVTVFSSNYTLYGDLSWRVMETLRIHFGANNVEVYSVDEAFVTLEKFTNSTVEDIATHMKNVVEQWTGIKVSVGVASTKALSKIANKLAKKNKIATQGVVVLDTREKEIEALKKTAIDGVWGIGSSYSLKLKHLNIHTAYDLSNKDSMWASKNLGGVVGVRLLHELQGKSAIHIKEELITKDQIMTTRMFGNTVTDLQSITEAVATYTSRAAEKLRRQFCAAKSISVFLVIKPTSYSTQFNRGSTTQASITLPIATSITHELIKPAVAIATRLFEPGTAYKKAGIVLTDIVPDTAIQGNLFLNDTTNNSRALMSVLDNINFSQKEDLLKYATTGTTRNWKMQKNFRSPKYTTQWKELCKVQ